MANNTKTYRRDFAEMKAGLSGNDLSDVEEFELVQMHVHDDSLFTEKGARTLYERYFLPNMEFLPVAIINADVSLEEKGVAALIFDVGSSSSNKWAWREPNWSLYFKAPFASKEKVEDDEEAEEIAGL